LRWCECVGIEKCLRLKIIVGRSRKVIIDRFIIIRCTNCRLSSGHVLKIICTLLDHTTNILLKDDGANALLFLCLSSSRFLSFFLALSPLLCLFFCLSVYPSVLSVSQLPSRLIFQHGMPVITRLPLIKKKIDRYEEEAT
jgi:hypothetical protein